MAVLLAVSVNLGGGASEWALKEGTRQFCSPDSMTQAFSVLSLCFVFIPELYRSEGVNHCDQENADTRAFYASENALHCFHTRITRTQEQQKFTLSVCVLGYRCKGAISVWNSDMLWSELNYCPVSVCQNAVPLQTVCRRARLHRRMVKWLCSG